MEKSVLRELTFGVAVMVVFSIGATAVSAQDSLASTQLATLVFEMWPGDFDNRRQIDRLMDDGAPIWPKKIEGKESSPFGGHLPVNSYYRQVELPEFGERVIYLEEYIYEDDPYRQRIYTVIDDREKNEARVKLWYFNDREKYADAWKDLSRLKGLTPDDMSPLPDNCDMVIRQQQDGRFHMKMPSCVFGEKLFDYQVILGPDSFWFRDRIANSTSGEVTMTAGSFTYHELDRVAP